MENLIRKLGLQKIQDYEYNALLNGGKASTSAIYINDKNEKIVVKFLIAPRNDLELSRFKDEVETLSSIYTSQNHYFGQASVPKVIIGLTEILEASIFFFAIEYIEGMTLLKYIEKNKAPWTWKKATYFLLQLSASCCFVNPSGYVHRDLHPGNIMLTFDDDIQFVKGSMDFSKTGVKILDFGCSKDTLKAMFNMDKDDSFRFPGSITSLSPELIKDATSVNFSHDTFALGTIFYYLIFGRYPAEFKCLNDVIESFQKSSFTLFPEEVKHISDSLPIYVRRLIVEMLFFDNEKRLSSSAVRDTCIDILYSNLPHKSKNYILKYVRNQFLIYRCDHCMQEEYVGHNICRNCGNRFVDIMETHSQTLSYENKKYSLGSF